MKKPQSLTVKFGLVIGVVCLVALCLLYYSLAMNTAHIQNEDHHHLEVKRVMIGGKGGRDESSKYLVLVTGGGGIYWISHSSGIIGSWIWSGCGG